MNPSLTQVLISMSAGIIAIILLTTRWRWPAFFALLTACVITGGSVGMPMPELLQVSKTGFGNTMQALGFIIVFGTLLGLVLEKSGCTHVMATFLLKRTGDRNAALAISITGFIVGLPVFCDSGFIVLNGLNRSMIRRTGLSPVVMSVSLATGLYGVHCLIPPHPGAAAAASALGVEFGRLIGYGILIAFPVMLLANAWARYMSRHLEDLPVTTTESAEVKPASLPGAGIAFLPVLVPIVLIAGRSLLLNHPLAATIWMKNLLVLGDSVVALLIGILIALFSKRDWKKSEIINLLHESLEKAGPVLLIISAGGAFGAILAATHIGDHFAAMKGLRSLGLFFPFLLTALLKTAQGSSTVAIITAASIVGPLLPALGLDTPDGTMIGVLAMGAGSMMVSHANDAYFWVIARFSGIDMRSMLKVYSTATIIMGLATLFLVWLVSLVIL